LEHGRRLEKRGDTRYTSCCRRTSIRVRKVGSKEGGGHPRMQLQSARPTCRASVIKDRSKIPCKDETRTKETQGNSAPSIKKRLGDICCFCRGRRITLKSLPLSGGDEISGIRCSQEGEPPMRKSQKTRKNLCLLTRKNCREGERERHSG